MDPIFENNFTMSAKVAIVIQNDVIVIEKKIRKKSKPKLEKNKKKSKHRI